MSDLVNADLTALYFGDYLVLERVSASRWFSKCVRCQRVRVLPASQPGRPWFDPERVQIIATRKAV